MKFWQATKRHGRLLIRLCKDVASRDFFRFSRSSTENILFSHSVSLSQEIKPSETFDNKLFNLLKASDRINRHIIQPNEVFSFWHAVGNPNNQFKSSRTIRNGQTAEEAGGGLCQASGLLYLVSLQAGLQILERYNHSVDLYTEETRFTPLGSDATVVYGYKDLRIKNSYSFPIKFQLNIINNTITVDLVSPEPITKRPINFITRSLHDVKIVETTGPSGEVLSVSRYKHSFSS